MEERVAPFVDTCAALFERHRGAVCSAVARPSASANYRTAAALLFLHDPARCHPFSPRKLQALDRRCGFGCRYRIARPECVAHYFDLAGQVADLLARDGLGEKVCAGLGIDGVEGLSARGRLTVAVDELARFAVTAG